MENLENNGLDPQRKPSDSEAQLLQICDECIQELQKHSKDSEKDFSKRPELDHSENNAGCLIDNDLLCCTLYSENFVENVMHKQNKSEQSVNSLEGSGKFMPLAECTKINLSDTQDEIYFVNATSSFNSVDKTYVPNGTRTSSSLSPSFKLPSPNNDLIKFSPSQESRCNSPCIIETTLDRRKHKSEENVPSDNKLGDEVKVEPGGCFGKYTRRQILTLICLCSADFASFLGMSIMAPFFPIEAKSRGMNEAIMGFVFSTYALVMFLLSPVFGYILPYVGANFLFLSGMFMAGGCTVLFGVLDEISDYNSFVILCFVVRSFEAMGAAACCTASCTIVANVFPDNVGAVFGIIETFVGFGMTVGPALGGTLYAMGGYKLPFLILGGFVISVVPLNFLILPRSPASGIQVESGSMIKLLTIPKMMMIFLAVTTLASSWSFLDPFLEPHLEQFQLTPDAVGLIFLMLAATYSIFSPIWGWVADRWDRPTLMISLGMLLASAALLLLGPSPVLPNLTNELWLNMVALIVLGITVALALIPTFQLMMDVAVENGFEDGIAMYSLVSGIWSAAYSLGDFVGPSVGGVLVSYVQFPIASSIIAGMITVTALAFVFQEACLTDPKKSSDLKSSYDSGLGVSVEGSPSEYTSLLSSNQKQTKNKTTHQILAETSY